VFDTHVHFPWGADRDPGAVTDEMAEFCQRSNIVHVALLGSRWGDYNDRVSAAMARYPDLFIGMVTLFHTGVIGGGVDYRDTDPFSEVVVKRARYFEKRLRGQGFSSSHMDPILLDTLAFTFPRLRIIGAHMGVGQYDYACHIARWRRNVFWDISGGELVRRHIFERKLIGQEISPYKVLFASDCGTEKMANEIADWAAILDLMRLDLEERDRIFYGNAARIFGVDEFAGVTDEAAYDGIWLSEEGDPLR
jgi:predicted TIM-barrel fold metal-dependent hydrolase